MRSVAGRTEAAACAVRCHQRVNYEDRVQGSNLTRIAAASLGTGAIYRLRSLASLAVQALLAACANLGEADGRVARTYGDAKVV